MKQPTSGSAEFNADFTEIHLYRKDHSRDDEFPLPEGVYVDENRRIRVEMTNRFYTTSGWEVVQVVVLYERFMKSN